MTGPLLVALAGPPGTGKSTLAGPLARALGGPVLAVDAVEDGLLTAGVAAEQAGLAAYVAVERVAEENLRAGLPVVVDAVNDHPLARGQWTELADRTGARLRFVELLPPAADAHRARLEARGRRFAALPEPAWSALPGRTMSLADWDGPRIRVTADVPAEELLATVLAALG